MPVRGKFYLMVIAGGSIATYGFDVSPIMVAIISLPLCGFMELAFALDEIKGKLQTIIDNQNKQNSKLDD